MVGSLFSALLRSPFGDCGYPGNGAIVHATKDGDDGSECQLDLVNLAAPDIA